MVNFYCLKSSVVKIMIIFNLNGENQFENFILQGKYDKAKELIVELKQRYRDSQQKLFMVNLLEISLLIEAEQWDICLEKIIALEKNSNKIDSTFLK